MRQLIPMNALRAFEAAARYCSFTKAASELHVTHGAVSRQVQLLETFLNCQLFDRHPGGLHLTTRGRELADGLRGAFEQIHECIDVFRVPAPQRVVVISTLPSLAARWLVPRLPRFEKQNPGIRIRIIATCALTDFDGDSVDIAIRYGRGRYPGMTVSRLFQAALFPVCAPILLKGPRAVRVPADLARVPLLHDTSYVPWQRWLRMAGVPDIDAQRGLIAEDMNVLIQAAIAGQGFVLGSNPLVSAEIAAGLLVKPFAVDLPAYSDYFVVYPRGRARNKEIKAVLDWLHMEAGQGLES